MLPSSGCPLVFPPASCSCRRPTPICSAPARPAVRCPTASPTPPACRSTACPPSSAAPACPLLDGVGPVVVRLLGGLRAWEEGLELLLVDGRPVVVRTGEQAPDANDIADSGDYFPYHGGMVATVRALRGTAPGAYIGDSTRPETVRTRTLVEETSRVFRARVVNPRWIEAMRRHGCKGAFERAATVDHLFDYDATTGVMADWMYDRLTETCVLDPANREFLREASPWAPHGIAERLLEAESRGAGEKPDPSVLEALRKVYPETEGDLENED